MISRISLQARLAILLLLLLATVWVAIVSQVRLSSDASARKEVETRLRTTSALILTISERSGFDRDEIDSLLVRTLERQGRGRLDVPDFEVRREGRVVTRSALFPEAAVVQPGLRKFGTGKMAWLVYTTVGEDPGTAGRAALPQSVETARAQELRTALTLPLAIGLPATALAVLAILWIGLRPLRRIEREIADISPEAPTPLDIDEDHLPRELRHLTARFNALMETVNSVLIRQKSFASVASHELRTPLAGARSHLDVLDRSTDPDLTARALRTLRATLTRMDRLVTQLLTLARGEARQPTEELDIASLLHNLLDEFSEQYPGADIALEGAFTPKVLHGHEALLRALFRNLIENAHRHGGQGGVRITLTEGHEGIAVTIEDDGPGFPVEDPEDLFVPFVGSQRKISNGAGLGLAVAKNVVDIHSGRIALRTRARGGATVVVTLPQHG